LNGPEQGRTFLDTNVLVYVFDAADPPKQRRAKALLRTLHAGSIVLSAQVLSEFFWVTTRKLATPLDHDEARSAVERLARLTVVPLDKELVRAAVELSRTAAIAYWDALVVKAARAGACSRLFTEDLNHGQVIDGVWIENPFLDAADEGEGLPDG
jgi:predicted nucleic acid-binding protein